MIAFFNISSLSQHIYNFSFIGREKIQLITKNNQVLTLNVETFANNIKSRDKESKELKETYILSKKHDDRQKDRDDYGLEI